MADQPEDIIKRVNERLRQREIKSLTTEDQGLFEELCSEIERLRGVIAEWSEGYDTDGEDRS